MLAGGCTDAIPCKCPSADEPRACQDGKTSASCPDACRDIPISTAHGGVGWTCPPCEVRRPELSPHMNCYAGSRGRRASGGHPDDCTVLGKGYHRVPFEEGGEFGQHCPKVNTHSVCSRWTCPPDHTHWNPPCTDCNYPNACRADCFTHPVLKDWITRPPNYRFYLQDRNWKPFRDGF